MLDQFKQQLLKCLPSASLLLSMFALAAMLLMTSGCASSSKPIPSNDSTVKPVEAASVKPRIYENAIVLAPETVIDMECGDAKPPKSNKGIDIADSHIEAVGAWRCEKTSGKIKGDYLNMLDDTGAKFKIYRRGGDVENK